MTEVRSNDVAMRASSQPAQPQQSKHALESARPYIGGQAVLEGVMMRAPRSFSIVVRRRDGSLLVRERGVPDERQGIRRWPLVRGVSSLVESLRLGSESLRFSVEQMEKDLNAEEEQASKTAAAPHGLSALSAFGLSLFSLLSADDGQGVISGGAGKEGDKKGGRGAMGVMLVFAIAFLIALPQAAAAGINRIFNLGLEVQSPMFQVITGALKLSVVVGYMLLIRRVPDIRRVFQYHGAEHKTISTYEAGEELVVANARRKTTLHPRCGTTFLVMVALVSILVFTAVGGLLPRIHTGSAIADNVLFFLEKLPFLPLIAAVTFEIQRVFARYCTTGPLRALLWPGFLVQKITTIEPEDDQLEVALASLKATLFREHGEVPEVADDVSFANYEALLRAPHLRT
ncbi:DUF1385 domain-containing protein [Pendulispora albinea]|uniref:DUF1385 domain-containing protein n=1 Tax=Pendulispora albinea TaxID=2741071 RepID=A0ABZ2M8C8_9BACT